MNYKTLWDSMGTWQPLIIAIFLTISVDVGHYAYWEIIT